MLAGLDESSSSGVAVRAVQGKTIERIVCADNVLRLTFPDGQILRFEDDGQLCCEKRYMVAEDDFSQFSGAKFLNAEICPGSMTKSYISGESEIEFLVIHTDRGNFKISNHNEHNGYYGGFDITAALENV